MTFPSTLAALLDCYCLPPDRSFTVLFFIFIFFKMSDSCFSHRPLQCMSCHSVCSQLLAACRVWHLHLNTHFSPNKCSGQIALILPSPQWPGLPMTLTCRNGSPDIWPKKFWLDFCHTAPERVTAVTLKLTNPRLMPSRYVMLALANLALTFALTMPLPPKRQHYWPGLTHCFASSGGLRMFEGQGRKQKEGYLLAAVGHQHAKMSLYCILSARKAS